MQGLAARYPNLNCFLFATLLAGIVGILNAPAAPGDLILPRMLFAAALVCFWFDMFAAATILAPRRDPKDPDRWVLAGHYAWFFGAYLFLASADSVADPAAGALGTLLGGLFFGAFMAFVGLRREEPPESRARFDLERPMPAHERWLYRLWPLIALGLAAAALAYPPEGGWSAQYICFLLVFLPTLLPAYRPARGLGVWRSASVPRSAGLILVLAGLLLPA